MQDGHTIKAACQRINNNDRSSDHNDKALDLVETIFRPNSDEYEKFKQVVEKYYKIPLAVQEETDLDNSTKLDNQLKFLTVKDGSHLVIKSVIYSEHLEIENVKSIKNAEFNDIFDDCKSHAENSQNHFDDNYNCLCPSVIFINDIDDHTVQMAFLGEIPEIIEV